MNEHILLAYNFDGNGGGTPLTEDEISHKIKDDSLAWIHFDVNHSDTADWMEKELSYLDPFIVKALLADGTRPRMFQIGDGVLLILRGVNLNENADPEDMVSIRLWIDKHRIISARRRKLKAVMDIEEKIKLGEGPKDAGQFVSMLVARLFERLEPVLSELDEITDDIEEEIEDTEDTDLRKFRESIVNVRKQAIVFRRYMAPQRDAIGQLLTCDVSWLKSSDKRHLQESFNHVIRYVEDLDSIRERAQIVKDELANIMADKINKNMYMLSVIAAIFLPLGFLTGLLGVNIGGIPGSENENSFWIFSMLLLCVTFVQLAVFKFLKWL
ncbi:MAG: zinc transporter ZntB [Rickettsiales bacterium]